MKPLAQLQATLGYEFRNQALVKQAITHCSSVSKRNNQRMEFLGDAVLGHVISHALYLHYPNADEGELSQRKVALVNGVLLAEIARELNIGAALIMSDGEEAHAGRDNDGNLEDALEALLGAILLDGGMEAVSAFIQRVWGPRIATLKTAPKDPKTALQEWAQARGMGLPSYEVISDDGPAHAPNFVVEVTLEGHAPARAHAGNKKQAERLAAEAMMASLTE